MLKHSNCYRPRCDNSGIVTVRHRGETFRACAKCYRAWLTSMERTGQR